MGHSVCKKCLNERMKSESEYKDLMNILDKEPWYSNIPIHLYTTNLGL